MIGQTISHYRITSQLGLGGMGVVYAAEDPRLNRHVALKFVPEDLGHDLKALERLRSEARTASSLNHPNICTIHDIGEHQGRPFIVMELLKGITLRDRLALRPIKILEVIDIGIQSADALSWAHSKDVIHRDIKPANMFLVDSGPLKILDFGLAKFVVPQMNPDATLAPTIDLTAVGVALGTVAYMSPEQVSGDTLDRRTDLFSLGVVLYECVTGQQPFKGKTSAVVLASILTQVPTAPVVFNPELPERLQDIIHTCLEKDRELRYQDASGLRADLKRVKRDLESGSLRAATVMSSGAVRVPSPSGSVSVLVPAGEAPTQAASTVANAAQATGASGPARSSRSRVVGLCAAVLVAAGVALAVMLRRSDTPPAADRAPVVPAQATVPGPPDAGPARFDEAILDANRLLAAGDADGATKALNVARAINPTAAAVSELSSRLAEQFRAQAEARRPPVEAMRPPAEPTRAPAVEPPRGPETTRQAAVSSRRQASAAPSAGSSSETSVAGASQSTTSPVRPAEPPPVVPSQAPVPVPVPPPARPVPVDPPSTPAPRAESVEERRAAPAPAEDDEAAIRQVVASYVRAIETKDIALYRAVKPNLSADEQRRIEDGFRAVASQRISVTIQSIERRGQDALVRLRRHDIIQAAGRQQTTDSQQTLTLGKLASGWMIREIGR